MEKRFGVKHRLSYQGASSPRSKLEALWKTLQPLQTIASDQSTIRRQSLVRQETTILEDRGSTDSNLVKV